MESGNWARRALRTMTSPIASDSAELTLSLLDDLPRDCDPERLSTALRVLSNRRRRHTLRVVREHGEEMALPDVADEVAVREHDRPLPEISAETVSDIYISIYHDHLPHLLDAGLLSYDQERDLVRPAFQLDVDPSQ